MYHLWPNVRKLFTAFFEEKALEWNYGLQKEWVNTHVLFTHLCNDAKYKYIGYINMVNFKTNFRVELADVIYLKR